MLSGDERRRLNEIASQLWQEDRRWAEGIGTGRPHRPKGSASIRRPRPWLAIAMACWLITGIGTGTGSWWAVAPGVAAALATGWLSAGCLPGRRLRRIRPDRPPRPGRGFGRLRFRRRPT
jgi:Protein of unknown function (DUF3040)